MTDIEQKALELVNAARYARQYAPVQYVSRALFSDLESALFAALEAHEADKSRHAAEMREQAERFSEAVRAYTRFDATKGAYNHLCSFILPAADPLVEAIAAVFPGDQEDVRENVAESIRAALEARGLAIVKKEAVNG